jgi:hypothetical protein
MGIDLSRDTLLSQLQVWIPIPQLAPLADYPRADRHHGSNVAIPRDSYSTTDTNGASLVNNRPSHATHQKNGTFLKKLISHWLMETTQPQLSSTSTYTPVSGEKATPFFQQTVVLTKQDYIALKWEANYWQAPNTRAWCNAKRP